MLCFVIMFVLTSQNLAYGQQFLFDKLTEQGDRLSRLETSFLTLRVKYNTLDRRLNDVMKENGELKQNIQNMTRSNYDIMSDVKSCLSCCQSTSCHPRGNGATSGNNSNTNHLPFAIPGSGTTRTISAISNIPITTTSVKTLTPKTTSSITTQTITITSKLTTTTTPTTTTTAPTTATTKTTHTTAMKPTSTITPTTTPTTTTSTTTPTTTTTSQTTPASPSTITTTQRIITQPKSASSTTTTTVPTFTTTTAPITTVTTYDDCQQSANNGQPSGITQISVGSSSQSIGVYCDVTQNDGAWLVIQRRTDGSVDFNRNWQDYKRGFGDMRAEFWLGNDNVYQLTARHKYTLLITMTDWSGSSTHARYEDFRLDSEAEHYRLNAGAYSGTAGDSFHYVQSLQLQHHRQPFSTYDRDNESMFINCARTLSGGWWFNRCYSSNLNGRYLHRPYGSRTIGETYGDPTLEGTGIEWYPWKQRQYSMKTVEMKIQRTHHRIAG